jgi:hypothetical protein
MHLEYRKYYIKYYVSIKIYGFDIELLISPRTGYSNFDSKTIDIRDYKTIDDFIENLFFEELSKKYKSDKIIKLNKMGLKYSIISDRFSSNCLEYSKEFLIEKNGNNS